MSRLGLFFAALLVLSLGLYIRWPWNPLLVVVQILGGMGCVFHIDTYRRECKAWAKALGFSDDEAAIIARFGRWRDLWAVEREGRQSSMRLARESRVRRMEREVGL